MRENDHLVEPLFGGLGHGASGRNPVDGAGAGPVRRRGSGRILVGLLVLLGLGLLAFLGWS